MKTKEKLLKEIDEKLKAFSTLFPQAELQLLYSEDCGDISKCFDLICMYEITADVLEKLLKEEYGGPLNSPKVVPWAPSLEAINE